MPKKVKLSEYAKPKGAWSFGGAPEPGKLEKDRMVGEGTLIRPSTQEAFKSKLKRKKAQRRWPIKLQKAH